MIEFLMALCFINAEACRQQIIINYAVRSAEIHQVNSNVILELIACESKWNEKAKGDFRSETGEYMANGILQFWPSTFSNYSKLYNIKGNYLDPFAQIDIAVHIIAYDKKGWKHWFNCGKAIEAEKMLAMR